MTFIERFTQAYLATAQWSSFDKETGDLDDLEWSTEAKTKALEDCKEFINKVEAAFDAETAKAIINKTGEGLLAPHDFWLTRVGHGAGFWDGDWDDLDPSGAKLTGISKSFKSLDVYKGDDDLLYFY